MDNGERLPAELVIVGAGVRPAIALAETAGIAVDRGVLVDEYLQTSATDAFAAGDIARFPYRRRGRASPHRASGRDANGKDQPLRATCWADWRGSTTFFWSMHYDVGINYVGTPADGTAFRSTAASKSATRQSGSSPATRRSPS